MKTLITLFCFLNVLAMSSGAFAETNANECVIEFPDVYDNSVAFNSMLLKSGFSGITTTDAKAANFESAFIYVPLTANRNFNVFEKGGAMVIDRAGDVLWAQDGAKPSFPTCARLIQILKGINPDCKINVDENVKTSPIWLSQLLQHQFVPQLSQDARSSLKLKIISLVASNLVTAKITDNIPITLAIAYASRPKVDFDTYRELTDSLFNQLGVCGKLGGVVEASEPQQSVLNCQKEVKNAAPMFNEADVDWLCGTSENTRVRGAGADPRYVSCLLRFMSNGIFDGDVLTDACPTEANHGFDASCMSQVLAAAPEYKGSDMRYLCGTSDNSPVSSYGQNPKYRVCLFSKLVDGIRDANVLTTQCKAAADSR